jgi:hypothetical protein
VVWYLPIGIYEGIKLTSEITDSTVDISGDGEIPHAVLRVGSGSIPLPASAGPVLEYLATAPSEVDFASWIHGSESADSHAEMVDTLNENGMVMSFDAEPLSDEDLDSVLIVRQLGARKASTQPEPYGQPGRSVLFENEHGSDTVSPACLTMVDALTDTPVPLREALGLIERALPEDKRQFADSTLQVGLQALVRAKAVSIFLKE